LNKNALFNGIFRLASKDGVQEKDKKKQEKRGNKAKKTPLTRKFFGWHLRMGSKRKTRKNKNMYDNLEE